jgi:thiol:disulfide interchange protein DsbD
MTWLLGFLLALGIGVWVYGVMQRADEAGRAPLTAVALAAISIVALAALPLELTATDSATADTDSAHANAYDPRAVAAELAEGRPVFVYFTADWCLTCKVNERIVLRDDRVIDELARRNVAMFRADWTRRDDTIRRELARFGRAGVPMYLVYDPRSPERPTLLPELLTVELFLDALRSIGA